MEGCGSSSSFSTTTTTAPGTTTSCCDKTQVYKLNGFHMSTNEEGQGDVLLHAHKKKNGIVSSASGGRTSLTSSNGYVGHQSSSPATAVTTKGNKAAAAQDEEFWKRKGKRKQAGESFEECSFWDAFCTYMCYAFLVIVGYINDVIRPRANQEKNRQVSYLDIVIACIVVGG